MEQTNNRNETDHGIHDECGVFGIRVPEDSDVASLTYYALISLQHRGQESAGIAVNKDRTINCYKDLGLVHDVFTPHTLASLGTGTMAVGHVRYSTSGSVTRENAQPMVVKHVKGQLAISHNGNLVNSFALRRKLELEGCIFHSTSDTEVISYIITRERLHCGKIEEAVARAMDSLEGAYSLVIMSPAKLIACRDPFGFRPLCYGTREDGSIIFASESCALDAVGAHFVRDLLPGEIMISDKDGLRSDRRHCQRKNIVRENLPGESVTSVKAIPAGSLGTEEDAVVEQALASLEGARPVPSVSAHCIFEYIYFSRPDSIVDGISVHDFRVGAGMLLASEALVDADLVIGVPDSGLDAATGYSKKSGIPYAIGLIKNKYIGRTFIAPSQAERDNLVRLKLNAIRSVIEGKRVVLIDDSIVRGTTSARIISLVREAGAKEVHMRISSPPFLNPCYYGTDIDSRENLIACHHTIEETAGIIGADSLAYLSVEGAKLLAKEDISSGRGFCCACFDGEYPTNVPEEYSKAKLEDY